MELCDRNCVILQTNRARCTLNMEIVDLLNEESISGLGIMKERENMKKIQQPF